MEGGEALSKGFVRGMTGIVTKPLEGAKSRGAYGALVAATAECAPIQVHIRPRAGRGGIHQRTGRCRQMSSDTADLKDGPSPSDCIEMEVASYRPCNMCLSNIFFGDLKPFALPAMRPQLAVTHQATPFERCAPGQVAGCKASCWIRN